MEPLLHRLHLDPQVLLDAPAVRRPRRASDLRGFVADPAALEELIRDGDPVIYETLEPAVPPEPGHLMYGITVLYPGRVGREYFLTRGHYHVQRETAEVYMGMRGRGYLVVQRGPREARALPVQAGSILYVAPGWAHRAVNTGDEPLVLFYVFPADAGHDYASIATSGFTLLVVEVEGRPAVVQRRPAGVQEHA